MSKRYKNELDKIIMSEEMKKRILHNVLNQNKQTKGTLNNALDENIEAKNIFHSAPNENIETKGTLNNDFNEDIKRRGAIHNVLNENKEIKDTLYNKLNENIEIESKHSNVFYENIEQKNVQPKIKKHKTVLRRNMQIIAASFTVVVCLGVIKNYPELFNQRNVDLEQNQVIKDENKDAKGTKQNQAEDNNKSQKKDADSKANENDVKEANSKDRDYKKQIINDDKEQTVNDESNHYEGYIGNEAETNNEDDNSYNNRDLPDTEGLSNTDDSSNIDTSSNGGSSSNAGSSPNNDNSSKIEQGEKHSGNSAVNPNVVPESVPKLKADKNTEVANPISVGNGADDLTANSMDSDNKSKDMVTSEDKVNSNSNNAESADIAMATASPRNADEGEKDEANDSNVETAASPVTSDDSSNAKAKRKYDAIDKENEEDSASSMTTSYKNPIKEYKTLEEAENAVNLDITPIKVMPKGFNMYNISTISNEIIEMRYTNGEDEIAFRAGKNIDNISGDYNIYEFENTVRINDISISLKGNKDNLINLAVWEKDNISYSISSLNGMDKNTMLNMIKSN